jgi:nucleoside-diphosphate-sugar epimerase
MKVAIVGASGFVGSTLAERLRNRADLEVVPCIHSTGSAGQIARLGISLTPLNLLDRDSVARTVRGCTHVVNCSRGDDEVMLKGLRNLLKACRSARVRRLVHLSSVAVYGDPPSPDSATEDGRAEPDPGSYGWVKLAQDRMVAEAAAAGLPATILCPPNISGVQSGYIEMIVGALLRGELALLEGGRSPCNLVDVRNLAHAIELALVSGPADGRRMLLTDDDPATWHDVVDSLSPLVGNVPISGISRDDLVRLIAAPETPRISLKKSVLHLVSSDVRAALRKDPLWAKVDAALRGGARLLGIRAEDRLRLAVEGPTRVLRGDRAPALNIRLCAQQLRGVVHRCDRARRELGYRPLYTFQQSMAAFRRWYAVFHAWDTPAAPLLKAL